MEHDIGRGYAKTMGLEPESFDVRLAAGDVTRQHRKDVESITSPTANDLGRFEVTRDPEDRWNSRRQAYDTSRKLAPICTMDQLPL